MPKYRRPVLTGAVAERLRVLLTEKAAQLGATIHAMEILPEPRPPVRRAVCQAIVGRGGAGVRAEVRADVRAEVRALTRKQPQPGTFPDAVEIALGDLTDPVSVAEAMKGVDKMAADGPRRRCGSLTTERSSSPMR